MAVRKEVERFRVNSGDKLMSWIWEEKGYSGLWLSDHVHESPLVVMEELARVGMNQIS